MKTALDTSVILDVLLDVSSWADRSEAALDRALEMGPLIMCECVLAEICPAIDSINLEAFMKDWGIVFMPSTRESAAFAGMMFARYLRRAGKKRRVLPDFLIGAHAHFHADQLLARDRGYYRDYFDDLKVIEP